MTYLECKTWVDENILRLMEELGLKTWKIVVGYERLEGEAAADVLPYSDYERAYVRLDAEKISLDDIERVIVHELLHFVCAPTRHFFSVAIEACKSTVEVDMLRELFRQTDERIVRALEKMRNGVIRAHSDCGEEMKVVTVKDWRDNKLGV